MFCIFFMKICRKMLIVLFIECICIKVMFVGIKYVYIYLDFVVYKFEIKYYCIVNLYFFCNFLDVKNE